MLEPEKQEAKKPTTGILGPRDGRLVNAFLLTGSIPKAAKVIGIDRSTAWRASKQPEFQDEVRRRLDEQSRVSRMRLLEHQEAAWAAIDDLLDSPDERIRSKVALWIADRALAEAHLQGREPAPTALELHLASLEDALIGGLTSPSVEETFDE